MTKRDSHIRSIIKGLTWRLLATTTTVIVAYIITGETNLAFKIGALEFFAKLIVYYFHERLWLLVPLGTIRSLFGRGSVEE
ncbi:MAG: DUF2061 domain-containing protein [Saprospiraceae bacterium]|nr:DUF2061 domain-containing protein [Saprospiraceae bacterium]